MAAEMDNDMFLWNKYLLLLILVFFPPRLLKWEFLSADHCLRLPSLILRYVYLVLVLVSDCIFSFFFHLGF